MVPRRADEAQRVAAFTADHAARGVAGRASGESRNLERLVANDRIRVEIAAPRSGETLDGLDVTVVMISRDLFDRRRHPVRAFASGGEPRRVEVCGDRPQSFGRLRMPAGVVFEESRAGVE